MSTDNTYGRKAASVAFSLTLAAAGVGALTGAGTWLAQARGQSTVVEWAAPPSSSSSNGSGTGQVRTGGPDGRFSLAGDPDDGGQLYG